MNTGKLLDCVDEVFGKDSLALAAARADDAATLAEIADIQTWHWRGALAGGSPLAPPQARALSLLHDEMLYS